METSREIRKEEMNHNLSPVKVCKQKADRGFGTLLPKFKEKGKQKLKQCTKYATAGDRRYRLSAGAVETFIYSHS